MANRDTASLNAVKCENCGGDFAPLTVNQRYCCASCGKKYRRRNPNAAKRHFPAITFNCSKCGRVVVTDGVRDMRTRFCSRECERKYWRHPPHDSPVTYTNFRNFTSYAAYERRTNNK